MKLTIEIKMENATFEDNPGEVVEILSRYIDKVRAAGQPLYYQGLMDTNGNSVGAAYLTEDN